MQNTVKRKGLAERGVGWLWQRSGVGSYLSHAGDGLELEVAGLRPIGGSEGKIPKKGVRPGGIEPMI